MKSTLAFWLCRERTVLPADTLGWPVLLLGPLLHDTVERPFLRWRARRLGTSSTAASPSAAW